MKRSNFALAFVFPVLLGFVLAMPVLPSYSQTGSSPKSTNISGSAKIPVQASQNSLRRTNPLRTEIIQTNAIQQVSGTATPKSPITLASPQRTSTESIEDFDIPIDLEVFSDSDSDFDNAPRVDAPVPSLSEGFDDDQNMSSSFGLSEALDDLGQFPDPILPFSGQMGTEAVTPQNAQPMAQVDPSATVNLPGSESGLLVPPSPSVRGITNQRIAQSQSQANLRVASNQIRQPSLAQNPAVQEFAEGTGIPGPGSLEGSQMPQLVLEKLAPAEVQVNQPATLKTVVKNVGPTTAKEIVLRDQIPRGTRLVSTNPRVSAGEGGDLYWSLGSLAPQEEIAVEMTVIPLAEGEFGSVATLQFTSEASGKTVATRAMLDLEITASPEVLLGEKITYTLTLSNPGTGTATGVVLELHVPDGLEHERGRSLEFSVGEIKPKETKQYPLVLSTKAAGEIVLELLARADNHLEAVAESRVAVLAPDLMLEITGPRQRFLNHKVAYTLTVANPGTASAQDVDLVAKLPAGMKFENTDSEGVYNSETHTVHWMLVELPAQASGEIELVLIPQREGEQTIRFEGVGQGHLKADTALDVSVQGIPSLSFGVVGLTNPVEVGQTAAYEIKVLNRGTRSANNVKIHVRLSEGMQFAAAEGPTRHHANAGMIQFDSLAVLEPKQEKTFKFTAKCLEVGDHRISVSLSSDEQKTPVTKEESTLVYGDE